MIQKQCIWMYTGGSLTKIFHTFSSCSNFLCQANHQINGIVRTQKFTIRNLEEIYDNNEMTSADDIFKKGALVSRYKAVYCQ